MMIAQLPPFRILPAIFRKIWLQIFLIVVAFGLRVGAELIDEHQRGFAFGLKALHLLLVGLVGWAAIRVLAVLRDRDVANSRLNAGVRSILFLVARVAVISLATLVALDTVGVSITPFIASLGVGSLAVALALQDTLGNLFSGFYLNLDRPIAPGDWIQLETGARGQTEHIGWRTTRVRLGDNNLLIIPNSKLASSIITNFSIGRNELSVSVNLRVAPTSDLDQVERLGVKIATEVLARVNGGVTTPPPSLRFQGFGESGIDLSVGFRVKQYGDQFLATHELVKALQKGFRDAKIEVPFPKGTPAPAAF